MKRIYAISPMIYYDNEWFQKDAILVPYAFYKAFGIEPIIVAAQREELVYLKSMPGLVVDVQQAPENDSYDQWIKQMKEYISDHIQEMDILFCIGSFWLFFTLVPYYKQLRPDGKVILKLDMNSFWQDKISMQSQLVRELYDSCDLITCEGKQLKRYLSKKWPYEIDYVPNGCIDLANETVNESSYDEKENIILTVGRIGDPLKGTFVLVEAFARCADQHPDWILKLVGGVQEGFKAYIEEVFEKYPELKTRIILTGKIVDKKKLYEEYRKAKVFAMTSYCEGMPNVLQEAAQHGCYMVCSLIDAANEFTNWERCGKVFPIGDIDSLIEIFNQILSPEYDEIMRKASYEMKNYHRRYFDYIVEVKKLMHLLQIKGDK